MLSLFKFLTKQKYLKFNNDLLQILNIISAAVQKLEYTNHKISILSKINKNRLIGTQNMHVSLPYWYL